MPLKDIDPEIGAIMQRLAPRLDLLDHLEEAVRSCLEDLPEPHRTRLMVILNSLENADPS